MKLVKNEIMWLLGALVFFGLGVSWLNELGANTQTDSAQTKDGKRGKGQPKNALDALSTQEVQAFLQPMIISRNVDAMVSLIKSMKPRKVLPLMAILLTDPALSREDKVHVLGGVAQHYADDKKMERKLFDLLGQNEELFHGKIPLFVLWADWGYAALVPDVIIWNKKGVTSYIPKVKAGIPGVTAKKLDIDAYLQQALTFAAVQDDLQALQNLYDAGIPLSKEQIAHLLENTVSGKNAGNIIPLLVVLGADLQQVDVDKLTPLMRAVKNNNIPLALALIKAGAEINFMRDAEIGTALQIAILHNFTQMEAVLRGHGAKEF